MIIDSHAHYAPQAMFEALAARGGKFGSVEMLGTAKEPRLAFAGRPATRPVMPKLRDAEARLAWMDAEGLDRQVVAPWVDSFGYELPAGEAADWTRFLNEHLFRACEDNPRLVPLASLPMQDGRAAGAMLREAMAAGFRGVMIGTQPHGDTGTLDDEALTPFWEAAHELEAVIYIHPMFGAGDPRVLDYDMINAVGRLCDTTVAVGRLLFSGHLLRYSGARCVLSHGGAALPFALGRLVRNVEAHPGQYADPRAGLARLWFDSVVFEPAALRYLCDIAGAERVMLGSDYPFPIGDPHPLRVVDGCRLTAAERREIVTGSTARLLGIG